MSSAKSILITGGGGGIGLEVARAWTLKTVSNNLGSDSSEQVRAN
jgi:NAD(P)-dependent dehydrogenase (short-subunit alcohol dehydrogenase family)